MANSPSSNSTTVSGSPPCSTASRSCKIDAPLSLSYHASQTAPAFQSNAAFTHALVRPTAPTVVREKDPLLLATPEPAPAHLPEPSPPCIPAVPTALSLSADTPSTTAVASPESDSSHISKEPSFGSQEDGELESSGSSDVEIFLSSLGLENAVPSAHTATGSFTFGNATSTTL